MLPIQPIEPIGPIAPLAPILPIGPMPMAAMPFIGPMPTPFAPTGLLARLPQSTGPRSRDRAASMLGPPPVSAGSASGAAVEPAWKPKLKLPSTAKANELPSCSPNCGGDCAACNRCRAAVKIDVERSDLPAALSGRCSRSTSSAAASGRSSNASSAVSASAGSCCSISATACGMERWGAPVAAPCTATSASCSALDWTGCASCGATAGRKGLSTAAGLVIEPLGGAGLAENEDVAPGSPAAASPRVAAAACSTKADASCTSFACAARLWMIANDCLGGKPSNAESAESLSLGHCSSKDIMLTDAHEPCDGVAPFGAVAILAAAGLLAPATPEITPTPPAVPRRNCCCPATATDAGSTSCCP
mmetsp:Transcript_74383/g.218091  ORF Transcript_74383/g.218091 Transcript_74383/m.218091 type:complete len:362 (+) Transcript_74383:765-1850(+)